MDDGGDEGAHDGGASADEAPPARRTSARAAAAEREYRPAVPLAMLRCLNKTHPANCTRCAARRRGTANLGLAFRYPPAAPIFLYRARTHRLRPRRRRRQLITGLAVPGARCVAQLRAAVALFRRMYPLGLQALCFRRAPGASGAWALLFGCSGDVGAGRDAGGACGAPAAAQVAQMQWALKPRGAFLRQPDAPAHANAQVHGASERGAGAGL